MAEQVLTEIHENEGPYSNHQRQQCKEFIEALFKNKRYKYASFSFSVNATDPLTFLNRNWQDHNFHYYWEKPSDEFAIAAGGTMCSVTASTQKRFGKINSQINNLKNEVGEFSEISHHLSGIMFLGGFSFFDQSAHNHWHAFPPASFTVPKWTLIRDGNLHWVTLMADLRKFHRPGQLYKHIYGRLERIGDKIQSNSNSAKQRSFRSSFDLSLPLNNQSEYDRWVASVKKAKTLISKNIFNKIVIARQITAPRNELVKPTQILKTLRQRYQNCYNFLVHQPSENTFLGSTPERLGTFRKNMLLTEALAGSIERGATATEDSFLAKNLTTSSKNRAEHNFVVKDIEERLHDYVESIRRNNHPEIKKLLNLQHLYTPIRATLTQDVNPLTIVEQLHPTPAVGGYPWHEAKPYVQKLENFDRGWYAGPVGWLNANGSGEFGVGIRSGLLTETKAHIFAGCGIVADSNPATEWEETNLKLKPMLTALQYD